MLRLSEDLFDDVEVTIPNVAIQPVEADELESEPPQPGPDNGIANILHNLIINENEIIQEYNSAIASSETRPEIIAIFKDILVDCMNHIGMLEVALEMISPNADNISVGETEAEEILR